MRPSHVMLVVSASIMLAGCVSGRAKDTKAYVQSVQRSPAYHMGYSDGCVVANYSYQRQKQTRDANTFNSDSDYREGWMAGTLNCKDTVLIVNTGKPNDHLNGLF